MKLVVINYSGNTGKSTLTKHLLVPQLHEARRVAIEDLNAGDGQADIDIGAKAFRKFSGQLNIADDDESFVIDIGSSVVKDVVAQFAGLETARDDIDFWIVPVTPHKKQQTDTMSTIDALLSMGVESSRVVVVPNLVSDLESFEQDFERISQCAKDDSFFFCPEPVLENEVYEELKGGERSVFDIIASHSKESLKKLRSDYRGDGAKMQALATVFVLRNASDVAARNLRAVLAATPIAARVLMERAASVGDAQVTAPAKPKVLQHDASDATRT